MRARSGLGRGDTFGEYTIESQIGRGGMGTVYLATHRRLGRKAALKVIAPELADDEDFRARFLRESQLVASIDHPNVIPIYDADEVGGVLFLAMRYVQGPSLQARLREHGPLSPDEAGRLATQVGAALDAAHRAGLVHRDVKPANILLAPSADHVYLCDFGLARRTSSQGMTRTGSFLGSIDYCSPEQIEGRGLDGRADVYSLGCVLFHCLSGKTPYARETEVAVLHAHLADPPPDLSSLRDDLPDGVGEVLATAMAKAPDDRYATAGALASALGDALASGAPPVDADATRAAPVGLPSESSRSETTLLEPVAAGADAATKVADTRSGPGPTRRAWLIGAVVLVAILAATTAVAVVALRGAGGDSGVGEADAAELQTFVDRVQNILVQSAAGREEIGASLARGLNCSIPLRSAGQQIASVADNRQSILDQLGHLPTPSPAAAAMVTTLQRALQESIEADRHYRDGFFTAADAKDGCPLPRNPAFDLAVAADARATTAKQRFVTAFNPLARRFHRRIWLAGEI